MVQKFVWHWKLAVCTPEIGCSSSDLAGLGSVCWTARKRLAIEGRYSNSLSIAPGHHPQSTQAAFFTE